MERLLWDEVRELMDEALRLPPAERQPFLRRRGVDSAARQMAASLIASYEQAESFLEEPAADVLNIAFEHPDLTGSVLGVYELLEELGRGGMGTVYRARRVDHQFEHEVAIKLLTAAHSPLLLARFRAERQILARLGHPNIAKLLDGGTTLSGMPYVVMELVKGIPIDEYVTRHDLPIPQRLDLFRAVCAAVEHAHNHMVVHRDIKPSNILVTADGVPKLLDFGIAKLLDPANFPGAGEQTTPHVRLFTPEYASPEQIRGGAITTGSDVFSLGVVLYKLLTGRLPCEFKDASLASNDLALCSADPPPPSTCAPLDRKRIRGDLDWIVLRALDKAQDRRYPAIPPFADDLRRFSAGLPVTARPDSLGYRVGKFVRRRRALVIASALALLSLLGGLVISIRETNIARRQEALAERRFSDVRALAASLFSVHDSIEHLPGSTPARKMIVEQAVRYLDNLTRETAGDLALERELASGYQRVAMVEGNPQGANLGDSTAALENMRKAVAMWDRIALAKPANLGDQLNASAGHRILASLLSAAGKPGGTDELKTAAAFLGPNSAASPDPRARRELGRTIASLANVEDSNRHFPQALDLYKQAYSLALADQRANPVDSSAARSLAVLSTQVADQLTKNGQLPASIDAYTESVNIFRVLAGNTNAQATRELAVVLGKRATALLLLSRPADAVKDARLSLSLIEGLLGADKQNQGLQLDLATAYQALGSSLMLAGNPTEGIATLDRAVVQSRRALDADSANPDSLYLLAGVLVDHADSLYRAGHPALALHDYHEALADFETLSKVPGQADAGAEAAAVHNTLGAILLIRNQFEAAAAEFYSAINRATPLLVQGNLAADEVIARAAFNLARIEARLDHKSEMCSFYSSSAEHYSKLPPSPSVELSGLDFGSKERALAAVRSCAATRPASYR